MPNTHTTLDSLFTDIADAIRAKDGSTGAIVADVFPTRISAIVTDPSGDATATAGDILASKTAYAKGVKLTGTIATKSDSGNVTLNTTTSSKTYAAGYYPNAHGANITLEDKSASPSESTQTITPTSGKVLSSVTINPISTTYVGSGVTRKAAATYYPSTSDQSIATAQYLTGAQTIKAVTHTATAAKVAYGQTVKIGDSADDDRVASVSGTFSGSTTISGTGKTAAGAGDILTGKSAFLNGAQLDGTMANNGAISATLSAGGSKTIPAGYTSGGTVTAKSLASQTGVDTGKTAITATQVLTGYQGWVNGNKISGTMANNGATGGTITTNGGTYTIPSGYTSGGTVTASIPGTTLTNAIIDGASFEEETGDFGWRSTVTIPAGMHNAVTLTKDFSNVFPAPETEGTASQLLTGYQLYNHEGKLITGTMTNQGAKTQSLNCGATYTIPAGYHNGSGVVTANSLASQTGVDSGKTAIAAAQVLSGYQGWVNGSKISGTMTNRGAVSATLSTATTSYTVPAGYHNGSGTVSITLETKTATPTESSQEITPTSGKVLSKVTVGAISSTYVGSAITRDPTMTASGAVVTAPAGYYSTAQTKSVATTTHPNPTVSTSVDTTNHKLNITASHAQTAGYVTAGTTTASTSITSIAAKTVTPSTSSQTAVAAGVYTEGTITVGAIPNQIAGGTKYATSSSQTLVAANKYLTSAVTLAAVTHTATAAKIAAGQTVVIGDSADADRIASVSGTFTSDATATTSDIASGKTAYVNGSKLTGTGVLASGDVTAVEYDAGKIAAAYLNGKATCAATSGTEGYTITSLVGSVTTESGKLVLNLADAC